MNADELFPIAKNAETEAAEKADLPLSKRGGKGVISFAQRRDRMRDGLRNQSQSRALSEATRPAAEQPTAPLNSEARWLDVELLDDNPYQPRLSYDEAELRELVEAINMDGQLQPILVTPHPTRAGRYQVVAGHRRKYAVKNGALVGNTQIYANAGAKQKQSEKFRGQILAVVRESVSQLEMRRIAYKENRSRSDLKPLENARFYLDTRDALSEGLPKPVSLRKVGEFLGENFQVIGRIVSLLELPEAAQKAIESGEINERHGRALYALRHWPNEQRSFLREIKGKGWSGARAEEESKTRVEFLREKKPEIGALVDQATEHYLAKKHLSPEAQAAAQERRSKIGLVEAPDQTKPSSPVAQIEKLPEQTFGQLKLALSMMESAAIGLEQLDIAAKDFPVFDELVGKIERLAKRSRRALNDKR